MQRIQLPLLGVTLCAGKMEIAMDDGMATIVCPNGFGESNVANARRKRAVQTA